MHSEDSGHVEPESLERGHEVTDVHLKPVIWFVIIFILVVGAVEILVGGALKGLTTYMDSKVRQRSPLVEEPTIPPEPELQPEPHHDRLARVDAMQMREREDEILNNYGAAPAAGITGGEAHVGRSATPNLTLTGTPGDAGRIPIARAMELIVQGGLPTRADAVAIPVPKTVPAGTGQSHP